MRKPRRPSAQGQALAEFALVIPLVLLILVGLFDVGRAVYAYNAVSNAAKAGARAAIVNQTVSLVQAEAANTAVALGIDPSTVVVEFLDPGGATTSCSPPELGCAADVEVLYAWQPITPIIGSLLGPFEIGSSAQLPIERAYP